MITTACKQYDTSPICHVSVLTGSTQCDRTIAAEEQKESHLASTIKHPNWVTIDIMVFDIHVDSALRTTVSCHARPPVLDAAPQTAAVRGIQSMNEVNSNNCLFRSKIYGDLRASREVDPTRGHTVWSMWLLDYPVEYRKHSLASPTRLIRSTDNN